MGTIVRVRKPPPHPPDLVLSRTFSYIFRPLKSQLKIFWIESDSQLLPFPDALFDGAYRFGLLHEFVSESAGADVSKTMREIHRVLKPSRVAIVATTAGDPEKGLPDVHLFTEALVDAAVREFHCIENRVYDDSGCTGRPDYKVWFGHLRKK